MTERRVYFLFLSLTARTLYTWDAFRLMVHFPELYCSGMKLLSELETDHLCTTCALLLAECLLLCLQYLIYSSRRSGYDFLPLYWHIDDCTSLTFLLFISSAVLFMALGAQLLSFAILPSLKCKLGQHGYASSLRTVLLPFVLTFLTTIFAVLKTERAVFSVIAL